MAGQHQPAAGLADHRAPLPAPASRSTAFFRESFDVVNADDDQSWRTAFVSGLFLPTDVARREAIIRGMPAVSPQVAAALMRAMAEFDGASALGKVKEAYSKLPAKMIKQVCDLRQHAEGSAAAESFE